MTYKFVRLVKTNDQEVTAHLNEWEDAGWELRFFGPTVAPTPSGGIFWEYSFIWHKD